MNTNQINKVIIYSIGTLPVTYCQRHTSMTRHCIIVIFPNSVRTKNTKVHTLVKQEVCFNYICLLLHENYSRTREEVTIACPPSKNHCWLPS